MYLPVFLEGFNEHAGLQETIFRILPARQSLKSAKTAGRGRNHGLIINLYEIGTECGIDIVSLIYMIRSILMEQTGPNLKKLRCLIVQREKQF